MPSEILVGTPEQASARSARIRGGLSMQRRNLLCRVDDCVIIRRGSYFVVAGGKLRQMLLLCMW